MLREYYERHLPHIQPIGATFFVTFRLQGSLPKSILSKLITKRDDALEKLIYRNDLTETERHQQQYQIERQYFIDYNDTLDTIKEGPHHLKIPELAQIVVDRMEKYNKQYYELCAYVIMSNHVHALLDFSVQLKNIKEAVTEDNYTQLEKVMGLIKGGSAKYCNDWLREQKMPTCTPFWESETYDRFMRNPEHYNNTMNYIVNNPVKIGLCSDWREYPFVMRNDV